MRSYSRSLLILASLLIVYPVLALANTRNVHQKWPTLGAHSHKAAQANETQSCGRQCDCAKGCNGEAKCSMAEKIVYTCPMHPEVKSDSPGRCPICHMDLEKKTEPDGAHIHS